MGKRRINKKEVSQRAETARRNAAVNKAIELHNIETYLDELFPEVVIEEKK